ncbi:hypothetical protein GCM10022243_30510 [Saccharothrix violaceirubra]|uniref:Uncharacterized protein n=1 Tax=Saccharothrix violaceirubra TaxID=413306 RepID=A0A7W7WX43_9PSEU|nr:hypothetical protein [Saccharothrix violaceirubra]MBB4966677.1 hypothetical protein [Saccharothrix violaceirubra]
MFNNAPGESPMVLARLFARLFGAAATTKPGPEGFPYSGYLVPAHTWTSTSDAPELSAADLDVVYKKLSDADDRGLK